MRGYVRTLEAIIASIALIAALILSVNLLSSRRDLGLIKKSSEHEIEKFIYGVIEYLAITGELSYLIYNNYWSELKNRLDELLLTRGIGYKIIVYLIPSDRNKNIEQRGVIVSNFNPLSASSTSIYYYVPPYYGHSYGYLLEIRFSR